MSAPRIAVPEAGLNVTVVGIVLVLLRVTTKSRGEPSLALGLVMPVTIGRSSVGGVPGGVVPVPSSLMTVVTLAVPTTAPPVAPLRFTL